MSVEFIQYGNISDGIKSGTDKMLVELGERITADAKNIAPVGKKFGGTLRDSIMYKTSNITSGNKSGREFTNKAGRDELLIGSGVEYAAYVEFGTRKMSPRPYMRPAIELSKGSSTQNVLKKILKEKSIGVLKEGEDRQSLGGF